MIVYGLLVLFVTFWEISVELFVVSIPLDAVEDIIFQVIRAGQRNIRVELRKNSRVTAITKNFQTRTDCKYYGRG